MLAIRLTFSHTVALLALALQLAACRAELPPDSGGAVVQDGVSADGAGEVLGADAQGVETTGSDATEVDVPSELADLGDATATADLIETADTADSPDTTDTTATDTTATDAGGDSASDQTDPSDTSDLGDLGDAAPPQDAAFDSADIAVPVDCNDNVTCTVDTNVAGTCVHTPDPTKCDDGNLCTQELCSGAGCGHKNSELPCDDGSKCTGNDTCSDGTCLGNPIKCNDNVACTTDGCDPLVGCTAAPVASLCADGNSCTDDSCVPNQGGCVNLANSATCSDGDTCTVGDTCGDKKCTGTQAICDDGIACTLDSCDKAAGCTHTPQSQGCDDKSECTADSCDPAKGCVYTAKSNGILCNTGSKCQANMVCKEGVCSGGLSKCAPTTKACFVTTCSESEGCADVWAKNGANCSDGELCTSADSCSDGACVGGPATDCSAVLTGKGPCWLAVCTPGKGCEAVAAPKDSPCDDKQFCTKTDLCDGAGNCAGSGLPDLCTAGKSDECGTFGCNTAKQACTVSAKNTNGACVPGPLSCAKTGKCAGNGACAPTDNTCFASYAASTYPKEPLAAGPQMARLSDGRLGLAWLHQYEKGQAGDAAFVSRNAYFTTVRADGLLGFPTLVYDGNASGTTMGSLQVLAGPDADGVAGAVVHMSVRSPGQKLCGSGGYSQALQSKWIGLNAALSANQLGSGSLPAYGICDLGGPKLWMSRQVRFGAAGPMANHTLLLENWTTGAATWTLLDAKGALVWTKPATDVTEMAHDLVQVGDRYVLYASGTSATGLQLSVLDPSAGEPKVASTLKSFSDATQALDVAIAAPSPNNTTWIALEAKTIYDRRLMVAQVDLSAVPTLKGLGATALAYDLKGGPARPSVAGTDDGWGVAAWEDDLSTPNTPVQRIVNAGAYSVSKGAWAQVRRMDSSIVAGWLPRVAFAGEVVISWVDGWYQNAMVTRVSPSLSGLLTKENDLPAPALAAGSAAGHQTAPAATTTSDGKLRIGWAVNYLPPVQLVERTFDSLGNPIDAAPRVLSNNSGGVLRLAPLTDGGWIGVWTEPEYDPATGAISKNHWKYNTYSKSDAPGTVQELVALGVGQPYSSPVGTAVAAIPGVSAAVLLSSGATDTTDKSDVLRVACIDAKGTPTAVATIANAPNKARAGLELRAIKTSTGQSQYWALWSESTAKLYSGKVEDILLQVLDSQCQPIGPVTVLVAGTEAGNVSTRMLLPRLLGTQQGETQLIWNRHVEGSSQGATMQLAKVATNFALGPTATIAGPWLDPQPIAALQNSAGTIWVALRNLGLGGGTQVVVVPANGVAPTKYSIAKMQSAVALTGMASGAPLLVYAQGLAKPPSQMQDTSDVYLQILPGN